MEVNVEGSSPQQGDNQKQQVVVSALFEGVLVQGTRGGEAFQFGASRDSQTAADTSQLSGGISTGAATFSFIQVKQRSSLHCVMYYLFPHQ